MTQNLINADSVSENIDEISLTTGFVLCKKNKIKIAGVSVGFGPGNFRPQS